MVSMNIAARNHCSRPMARYLHGHNVCAEISPKALPRLNFQVKHSGKFGTKGEPSHASSSYSRNAGRSPTDAPPKIMSGCTFRGLQRTHLDVPPHHAATSIGTLPPAVFVCESQSSERW